MSTSGGGGDPWAWLGLLKWSLSYSDGTKDNSDMTPMSPEDRAFLENVMKEGIIDENERMKFILKQATSVMEYYQKCAFQEEDASSKNIESSTEEEQQQEPPISEDALKVLLQELRDIVEQIDYARAFLSLKGLPFLLGCVSETKAVPETIRLACFGILATVCQNNPPVQNDLLELGALKTYSDLFFLKEEDEDTTTTTASMPLKARIMQATSSCVRNHEVAELVFSHLEQAPALMAAGLDPQCSPSPSLQSRTLFFLRALVTSDTATPSRVHTFAGPIVCVIDHYLQESVTPDFRETALALLVQLLEQKNSVNAILLRKDALAALGVQRISALQASTGEDREYAQTELELWTSLMVLLVGAIPDQESSAAAASTSALPDVKEEEGDDDEPLLLN
jgi:hsp70-interacting protein